MHPSIHVLVLGVLVAGLSTAAQRTKASDPRAEARVGPTFPLPCATSIEDQANPGACLQASSVPAPGLLFPPPHDGGVNNERSGALSFVGGGKNNTASDAYSTVGGGYGNHAFNEGATIGGGYHNSADLCSTVGGGLFNVAQEDFTTVGGGLRNTAWEYYATVAGGVDNTAIGTYATVGGGANNRASQPGATVPGGSSNTASGEYSFAAGRLAIAGHDGSFVWGDSQGVDKLSSVDDQFNVYASGGARFFTNASATTGVLLAPGGGSWSSVSDREAKENFEPVDGREVLELVAGMPIWSWNYKAQGASVRHMGPVAQDFHAAFELGVNERLIDTIDPDGVALAAIQGLKDLLDEKDAELAELRERVARLEGVEARLERVEASLAALAVSK